MDNFAEEDSSSELTVAKVVAMVALFACSLLAGLVPVQLHRWFKWDTSESKGRAGAVSLLLCFAGGVLLCTTFLHLLPEVSERAAALEESGALPSIRLHLGEFLMCIGFFTMYLVEECVHAYVHAREEKTADLLVRTLSLRRRNESVDEGAEKREVVKALENGCSGGHSHLVLEHNGHDSLAKNLRALLVVLALSVHELFEGLAVGLETSSATVWYMFGAVSAHKFVLSFCIGVELVASRTGTLLLVTYVFAYSFVSALGIGLGIAVSAGEGNAGDAPSIAGALLQGLAAGTLLYVVFFEVLSKRNDVAGASSKSGLKRYLAVLAGFLVMMGLTILAGHDHGSGEHDAGHHHDHTHLHGQQADLILGDSLHVH